MEGSINQAADQSNLEGRTIDDSPQEESGWTIYFDEFFSNNRKNSAAYSSSSSGLETPSLISDAASCVPWKFSDNNDAGGSHAMNSSKKLRLLNKKKKTRGGVIEEDALEDTASSPVNSPKVSSMKQYQPIMNSRKTDIDDINIEYSTSDQRKGSMPDHFKDFQMQTDHQLGFIGRDNNEYTDLKKKGLCLVPLSMFMNLG